MKLNSSNLLSRLPVIAGLAIFVLMTALLDELSENIINHEPLSIADVQLSNWLHLHGNAVATTLFRAVTLLGSTVVAILVATAFGLFLLWKRRFAWVITFAAAVLGGSLLNRVLKYFFQRPRPHFDDPILTLTSYSFPSGHTMIATVLYGAIAAYLLAHTRDWKQRVVIVLATAGLILLVGFSRIYLGAHYLSDVLAAFAEGLAWLSLCLTVLLSVSNKPGPSKKTG